MPAELVTRYKSVGLAGDIIEAVVWRLDGPVPPSEHPFKYRLVYIQDGKRVVGFDNERGKGDHSHVDGRERAYRFVGLEQLFDDFTRLVEERKAP
jgi:hypothetical protein